jgi:hypothetical protein
MRNFQKRVCCEIASKITLKGPAEPHAGGGGEYTVELFEMFRGIFVSELCPGSSFSEGRKPETFFPCHRHNEVRRILLSYRSSF